MKQALACKDNPMPVVQMLVLRGVPVRPGDYEHQASGSKLACLLLEWAEAELTKRQAFVALVLGCGVHTSREVPPAQRSRLAELRGGRNTEARMCIAQSLGVRVGTEVGHLRRAAAAWRAMQAAPGNEGAVK